MRTTNFTIAFEPIEATTWLFWGISRTAAHFGLRIWRKHYFYIGVGDAS